ncbi:peptidoglycan-binding domain-containing protein [Clostridium rectalis]|uniref:peptidoglycan-binding domain-containing protein n=1 Tax=Clostridium rectalis TaxID=2040295 RepID=UPI000F636ED7|nr:peptidoglycan-binding domain-containing protein [Clostridium rectalis]
MPEGRLKVQVFKGNSYIPVENAKVTISTSKDTSTRQSSGTLTTDSSGLTKEVELSAPSLAISQQPSDKLPYSLYDLLIEAPGYTPIKVNGCQVYPDQVALQQCNLNLSNVRQTEEVIDIKPNRLVGNFPPKIPEDPNKKDPPIPSGLVVLPEPVVPQFIVVHTGLPDNPSAPNYTIPYKDYVKNVASSEIFSTWPETTIRANVFCIISFTLNRIYTEWYRGKGKNFDITNSTAYDHAFVFGRNIYDNISRIVDDIFSTYVKRSDRKQPLLTQYCDGVKVQCPGWLTQWGSKYLGDQGKTPYEILTNFYGPDLSLNTARKVSGIPKSYPGYTLTVGSRGPDVRTAQTYLNRISVNYPAIPKMAVDGIYGEDTQKSVKVFQSVFSLPQTGNIDYATWYRISDIYVAVTQIAELRSFEDDNEENYKVFIPPVPSILRDGPMPTTNYIDDIL